MTLQSVAKHCKTQSACRKCKLYRGASPLQIAGVCLSVALIYLLGNKSDRSSQIRRSVIRLGKYSLFAYISQIAILRILERSLRPAGTGVGVSGVALLAGLALTILSVEVIDRTRVRSAAVNRLYGTVFS